MWKNIKTILLGLVMIFIGIIVVPISTTILVRGLDEHEVRFTMPNEMEIAADTGANYNVVKEFMNVFRTKMEEVEKDTYLPKGVDVMVENFDSKKFQFWVQFGYITAGSLLAILFTVSGVVCCFLGYTRMVYRDSLSLSGAKMSKQEKLKEKAAIKARKAAKKRRKERERQKSFMGMRSS